MALRRQAKTARSGKIQRARIACNLPDDKSEIAAAHAFFQRKQRVFGLFCQNMNHAVADIGGKPGAIGPAIGPHGRAILNPQHGTLIVMRSGSRPFLPPLIKRQRQSCSHPATFARSPKHLAMARTGQTGSPTLRRVESARGRTVSGARCNQIRTGSGENRRIHLFFLCSIFS